MLAWANDMWPFVNGKALMSGLNLKKMEASEMMDVVHFLFEEDRHFVSEESAKSRSQLRVVLFRDLYGVAYKYPYTEAASKSGSPNQPYSYDYESEDDGYMSEAESAKPFDPLAQRKPDAQPITQFDPTASNPFNGILDAPFN